MTTYAELTTQILNYTETSTDVLSSTITDDFIEHTENRILREADLDAFKSHQYTTVTADNAFVSCQVGLIQIQHPWLQLGQCIFILHQEQQHEHSWSNVILVL